MGGGNYFYHRQLARADRRFSSIAVSVWQKAFAFAGLKMIGKNLHRKIANVSRETFAIYKKAAWRFTGCWPPTAFWHFRLYYADNYTGRWVGVAPTHLPLVSDIVILSTPPERRGASAA